MPGAFCTPLVIALSPEISEAVIPGPDRAVAYDVNNGKELWSVDYDGFSEAARPVYGNGLVYFASGGFRTTLFAVRPQGSGNLTATGVVWQVKKDAPSMPSPVLVGNRLFAVNDNSGVACCLDALTGTDLWRQKIGGKFCASLLAAPGRIYFFDSNGVTTVVEAADSFKVLATNKLDAGCMASAAVAGNALLVRTKTHLYRIEQ
jgi:outer membrane protein assembly factor BamB